MKEMLKPSGEAKLMSYVQKNEVLGCSQERAQAQVAGQVLSSNETMGFSSLPLYT